MSAREEPSDLNDLYREIILDHYRSPRRRGRLPAPTISREGLNPLCGDEITLDILVEGSKIKDLAFQGAGCSISQSAASMLADAVAGKSIPEALALARAFTAAMQGSEEVGLEELGDLEALTGVRKFPVRVKCATLSWRLLQQALESLSDN